MDSFLEKVSHLSTGNQQKVLLSRWLFSNCRILMLEEPTKNIDKSSKIEIYNFMNSFVQRGGTIIFISSHIEELIGMCDRIAVFSTNGMYGIINREEFNKESIIEKGL
jgi:ABC-type sugar transport system ATPase subunit